MPKYRTMAAGNGITGPTGEEYRELINDFIPNDTYIVESDFVWTTGNLANYPNRVLKITHTFALGSASFTLPAGCTLQFEGGSIATTGTITGAGSRIVNIPNLQCFSVDVIFAGTWIETECNFQWFGAKSVPTRTTYTNECSAAINKAVNSPFGVDPIPGIYYITSPIIYTKPKGIFMGSPVMENTGDGSLVNAIIPDQVRFITDQNINVFEIRTDQLYLTGGVIDVRGVSFFTKDAIRAQAQYCRILSCKIYMGVVGSMTATQQLGASGKAFHWDMTDNTVYGCMHNMDLKMYISCIPYGIYIDDSSTGHSSTNMGANSFHAVADGLSNKRYIRLY